MKHLKLFRFPSTEDGTFGVLLDGSIPFCLTLERPWLNNEVGKSCIPDGEYICWLVKSPQFGLTFEVRNVPDRTLIRFHIGNLQDDSHGCIILGERYDPLNGKNAILSSGDAFKEFMSRLEGENFFKLTIKWIKED